MGEGGEHPEQAGPWKVFRSFLASVLKRHWTYRNALGIAAFVAVGVGFYGYAQFKSYQAQHTYEREKAAENQTHEISQNIAGLEITIPGIPKAPPPQTSDYATYYDLKAQQDMAEWTYSMLWVGIVGLLASVVGIGFVYANLREMRAQTLATREVGEKQTRAYVFASSAEILVSSPGLSPLARHPPFVLVNVENTGETPATIVEGKATLEVQSAFGPQADKSVALNLESTIDALVAGHPQMMRWILPKDEFDVRPPQNFPGNALAGAVAPESTTEVSGTNALAGLFHLGSSVKKVICRGHVTYFDVFGDQFSSEFHFEYFGTPAVGSRVMMPIWSGLRMFLKIKDRKQT